MSEKLNEKILLKNNLTVNCIIYIQFYKAIF